MQTNDERTDYLYMMRQTKEKYFTQFILCSLLLVALSCSSKKEKVETTTLKRTMVTKPFGTLPDGRAVTSYKLTNKNGMTLAVINYGGIIVSLTAPDRSNNFDDVVLGYDSLTDYLTANPYFGALIGRYGNRISKGKFTLDGTEYTLALNNDKNNLHGGPNGFDKVFWDIESVNDHTLKLTYASPDNDQGFPGNLLTEVIYTFTDDNEVRIDYKATTDKPTVVNLTQHTYFNLAGHAAGDILEHELQMDAESYLPVDENLIPTGEIRAVKNTPFDFTKSTSIGERINESDEQLVIGKGYDHCWVLDPSSAGTLRKVGSLYDSSSGRVMEVLTTEPGIQVYSGNFLDGSNQGKGGHTYAYRTGICLETQHFPDSPNQTAFPSVTLRPGEVYTSTTVYKFSTK